MKKQYIIAVLEMIRAGNKPDEVLAGLQEVLKKKGHERLATSVLAGVLRILEAESSRSGAVVTVAKAADADKHKAAIAAALKDMGHDGTHETVEDDTLIGGFTVSVGNTVLDSSYKSALVKLYRDIAK